MSPIATAQPAPTALPAPTGAEVVRAAEADPRPVIVRVEGLGKCFHIYRKPLDRVWEWMGAPSRHTDFWAVRGVSFEVRRGECLGIIGANGSGKSTLLKIVSGALYPSEGTFAVDGLVLSLIELGTGLNPNLSGRENIVHAAALLGFPADFARMRTEEIQAFADLGAFFERPVNLYSSGMKVRLAFAMFACFRPEVFIVDEALSVGDVFFQQKCATRIRELLDDGMTMIFVSHDQSAVLNLCDRAIVLSQGEPIFYGQPEEAVSRYITSLHASAAGGPSGPGHRWGASRSKGASPAPLAGSAAPTAAATPGASAAAAIIAHDVIGKRGEHRHGTGQLMVVAARVTNAQGQDTMRALMGQPLSFQVLLEARARVESPRAGIRFFDRFNNLVFGCGTFQAGTHLPAMDAGERLLVRFDVTLDVEPGQYSFGLGAGEPAEGNVNAGTSHDRIDLLGPVIVGIVREQVRTFYGMARLPMRVSVEPVEGETK